MGIEVFVQLIFDWIRNFFGTKDPVNESESDSTAWVGTDRDALGRLTIAIRERFLPS